MAAAPALAIGAGVLKAGSQVSAADAQASGQIAAAQQQANEDQVSANLIQGQQYAALYNAAVAGDQAKLAVQTSDRQAAAYRLEADQTLGTMRASAGASGAVLTGSALDVLKASAANAELNVLTIQHTGALEAWGYTNSQNLDLYQAANAGYQEQAAKANAAYAIQMGQFTAANTIQAGNIAAAGTLLGAAASPGINALMPIKGASPFSSIRGSISGSSSVGAGTVDTTRANATGTVLG